MTRNTTRASDALLYMILAAALGACLLPWATAPSAPLTLNVYDLAEFLSLHPAQRATSPPLLATLLLRAQLLLLCALFASTGPCQAAKLWRALVIALLAAAQLPPPELLLDPANLNYRQQLGLALLSLGSGLLLLWLRHARLRLLIMLALSVCGMVCGYAGLAQALDVYSALGIAGEVGLGFWLLMLCYASLILTATLRRKPGVDNPA